MATEIEVAMSENSKEIELLPCPFCGGKADMDFELLGGDESGGNPFLSYFVYCQECLCGTTGSDRATKDLAITRWNTRRQQSTFEAQLEAARREGFRAGRLLYLTEDEYINTLKAHDERSL